MHENGLDSQGVLFFFFFKPGIVNAAIMKVSLARYLFTCVVHNIIGCRGDLEVILVS